MVALDDQWLQRSLNQCIENRGSITMNIAKILGPNPCERLSELFNQRDELFTELLKIEVDRDNHQRLVSDITDMSEVISAINTSIMRQIPGMRQYITTVMKVSRDSNGFCKSLTKLVVKQQLKPIYRVIRGITSTIINLINLLFEKYGAEPGDNAHVRRYYSRRFNGRLVYLRDIITHSVADRDAGNAKLVKLLTLYKSVAACANYVENGESVNLM